jgi:hypothetical protein
MRSSEGAKAQRELSRTGLLILMAFAASFGDLHGVSDRGLSNAKVVFRKAKRRNRIVAARRSSVSIHT